jgi:hypothetical protein
MEDSSLGRLLGVFVAPGRTFRSIAVKPTWLLAWLVFYVVSCGTLFLAFQKVDFAAGIREQMAAQHVQMPAGGEERAARIGKTFGLTAVAFTLLLLTFVPPAIYLVLNLFGGELDYRRSLAVSVHAGLPRALAALLSLPVILSRGAIPLKEVQGGGLLLSNLAFLAPDAGPALRVLLVNLDLFALWSLVLSIVGYHIAAKVSRTTATAVVVGLWLLGIGLQVGLAALGSQFRGGH